MSVRFVLEILISFVGGIAFKYIIQLCIPLKKMDLENF
jgi:hypothetical protein